MSKVSFKTDLRIPAQAVMAFLSHPTTLESTMWSTQSMS